MLDGEACAAMKSGQRVELTAIGLLHGILVGYTEGSPVLDISKTHLLEALEDLVRVFRAPSLEILLLDASANLRDLYGPATALTALETAIDIVPQSSMVRNDLVLAKWAIISDKNARQLLDLDSQRRLCNDIVNAYAGINLSLVPLEAEMLVYVCFVALAFLHHERDDFLLQQVQSHVRNPVLVQRLRYILAHEHFDLGDAAW